MSLHQLRLHSEETDEPFPLPEGLTYIGRDPECALHLAQANISGRHAVIVCHEKICTIEDLGSINGTWINAERLIPNNPQILRPNDAIKVAFFEMRYEYLGEWDTAVSPANESSLVPSEPPTANVAASSANAGSAAPEPNPAAQLAPDTAIAKAIPADGHRNGRDGTPPPKSPLIYPSGNGRYVPSRGLFLDYSHYIRYLPAIYDLPYFHRFLALLESILAPVEWTIENFDLFLDPRTCPAYFLPTLAGWLGLPLNVNWGEEQLRRLILAAPEITAGRGTAVSLRCLLEIFTGVTPLISDQDQTQPHTFAVTLPLSDTPAHRIQIQHLIDAYKPAHTTYNLFLTGADAV